MESSLIVGFKIPVFDHIIDNIFLGDIEAPKSNLMLVNKIKHVFNISNSRYEQIESLNQVIYYHYDIDDERNQDILQFFNDFITIVSNSSSNILVHCANSVSRSVTLVLSYLIQKMSLKEAIIYLKSRRSQYTKPNIGFMKQLLTYEKNIYQTNSLTLQEFLALCK